MDISTLARVWQRLERIKWSTAVWMINGAFILMTAIFWHLPNNRQGSVTLLPLFSLQFEKNFATCWEVGVFFWWQFSP